jgi:hypothetical protein
MDHTHCFTCGRELDKKLNQISSIQDDRLFGLFPEFVSLVCQQDVEIAIGDLTKLDVSFVNQLVDDIPVEWQVSGGAEITVRVNLSSCPFRCKFHFEIDRPRMLAGEVV